MRFTVRALVILLLGTLYSIQTPMSATSSVRLQDQRTAAAKELEPMVLDFYNTNVKEKVAALSPKPYVSLTVATKRYDASYALVSLSIDTNDPILLAKVADLDMEIQPVEFANGKITRTVGKSMSGVMKAPGASQNGSTLHKISFYASVVEEANAINLQVKLATAPRPLEINFTIDLTNEVRVGATGRGSPTLTSTTNKTDKVFLKTVDLKSEVAPELLGLSKSRTCCCDCSCEWTWAICMDGACSNCCDACGSPPQAGCAGSGCYILCSHAFNCPT